MGKEIVEVTCPHRLRASRDAMDVIQGKWRIPIIISLTYGNKRFGEINRDIGDISPKMLSQELKALEEYTLNNKNAKRKFELYNNDIIMNNNAMIMNFKDTKSFVYPYTLLKFFIINNHKACSEQEEYLIEQLRYCTHITNTSVREHAANYNHKYDKINQVMHVIKNEYNQPMFL